VSRYIVSLLALLALLALGASAPSAQVSIGKEFDLAVGESATVESEPLTVGFEKVAADSRCPIGVLCCWEGDAAAEMWADLPELGREGFVLHSYHGLDYAIRYGNYVIELKRVSPDAEAGRPIDPKAYVVTVQVTGGKTPVTPTTWSRIKALYGSR
jgi:hypothetical protein